MMGACVMSIIGIPAFFVLLFVTMGTDIWWVSVIARARPALPCMSCGFFIATIKFLPGRLDDARPGIASARRFLNA